MLRGFMRSFELRGDLDENCGGVVLAAAGFVPRIASPRAMWVGTGVLSELRFAIRGIWVVR